MHARFWRWFSSETQGAPAASAARACLTHSSRVPRLPSLIVSCSRNETHGFPTHVSLGIHACHLTPNDPATRRAQRSTLARLLCVACRRACLVYALPDKRRMLLQRGGQCALPGPGRPHQDDSDRPGVAIPRRRRRRWLPIGSLAALVPVCVSTVAFPTCLASMCCMTSSIVPQDQQMIKASHRFSAGSSCSGAGCIAGSAANNAWPSAAAGALAAFVVTAGYAAASVAAAAEADSAESPSLRI